MLQALGLFEALGALRPKGVNRAASILFKAAGHATGLIERASGLFKALPALSHNELAGAARLYGLPAPRAPASGPASGLLGGWDLKK